jgi:hypothetical protein
MPCNKFLYFEYRNFWDTLYYLCVFNMRFIPVRSPYCLPNKKWNWSEFHSNLCTFCHYHYYYHWSAGTLFLNVVSYLLTHCWENSIGLDFVSKHSHTHNGVGLPDRADVNSEQFKFTLLDVSRLHISESTVGISHTFRYQRSGELGKGSGKLLQIFRNLGAGK